MVEFWVLIIFQRYYNLYVLPSYVFRYILTHYNSIFLHSSFAPIYFFWEEILFVTMNKT